jgi:hypothetical protein
VADLGGALGAPNEPRGGMTWVTRPGDTLEGIALAVYGDAAYAMDIELANFSECSGDERVFTGEETLELPVIDVPLANASGEDASAEGGVCRAPELDVCEAPEEEPVCRAEEAPAAPPTQVSNAITDGPYGWDSKYEVSFGGSECRLNINIKVVPQPDVSAEEAEQIKGETASAFTSLYDRRFTLTDTTTHEAFTLRVGITYVDSGEHLLIDLYSGNRRNNLTTWSTERPVSTRAHELGHQLGLKDEYVDDSVPDRATETSPGVHTDHSIMGNYHSEGYAEAEAKQRHGELIGGHIGSAVGRTFSITTNER